MWIIDAINVFHGFLVQVTFLTFTVFFRVLRFRKQSLNTQKSSECVIWLSVLKGLFVLLVDIKIHVTS